MDAALGKVLIVVGIVLVAVGLVFVFNIQVPWLGKLPGDISVKRGNWHFYFPLATSILLSVLLTLILYLFRK